MANKALREVTPDKFTQWTANQISRGFRLVPFIGSGMSAASGITMGQDFSTYISWVAYRCVSAESTETGRWNLRKQGWPDFPKGTEIDQLKAWLASEFREVLGRYKKYKKWKPTLIIRRPELLRDDRDPDQRMAYEEIDEAERAALWVLNKGKFTPHFLPIPEISTTSEAFVRECAVRSLCDWLGGLHFLARMRQDEDGLPLQLAEEADQAVIDSFNHFMTHGRKPNLGHNMLCHLAERAGITTILTTNFDTLIEDAFSEVGERYEVLPVSVKGALPAPETVYAQNCIIKLHGGLSETRADHSIDHPPTPIDLVRFFQYVRGYDARMQYQTHPERFLPGVLLVCGYSGSDLRCVQMIKHVLNADKDAQVLWVCHTARDEMRVRHLFAAEYGRDADRMKKSAHIEPQDRVVVTRTSRVDLLLFELYQRLTLSLPRGGFSYQFVHSVPPDGPLSSLTNIPKSWDPAKAALVITGPTGLLSPLRRIFEEQTSQCRGQGIWIEMEDYADVFGIAHELFMSIAIKIGRFQLDHARLLPVMETPSHDDWISHIQQLFEHWGIVTERWFVLFYGRNGPGGCSGWQSKYWHNGDTDPAGGQGAEYKDFENFAAALVKLGFKIVYAPFSESRYARYVEKMVHVPNVGSNESPRLPETNIHQLETGNDDRALPIHPLPIKSERNYRFNNDLKNLKAKFKDNTIEKSTYALYNAMLFRQSRHFSAFLSQALLRCPNRFEVGGIDNDWKRFKTMMEWIETWNKDYGLFQNKPGGFYWAYQDMRTAIVTLGRSMAGDITIFDDKNSRIVAGLVQRAAHTHFHIGDWYVKAYRATGHVLPLIESLYHFGQCLHYIDRAEPPRGYKPEKLTSYRKTLIRRSVYEITKLLRIGRNHLRFWLPDRVGETWFGGASEENGGSPDPGKRFHGFKAIHQILNRACDSIRESDPSVEDLRSRWTNMIRFEFMNLPRLEASKIRAIEQEEIPIREARQSKDYPCFHFDLSQEESFGNDGDSDDSDWLKQVRAAVTAYDQKFGLLGSNPNRPFASHLVDILKEHNEDTEDNYNLDAKLKEWRDDIVSSSLMSDSENSLLLLAQITSELAYSFVKRAKRLDHAYEWDKFQPKLRVRKLWVEVCSLCWVTLNLCYDLPPAFLTQDCQMRVKTVTIYGLALGWLGRFHEAHRRFNEAHALLSKMQGTIDPLALSIIRMRQSEVYVLEATRLRKLLGSKTIRSMSVERITLDDPIEDKKSTWNKEFDFIDEKYRVAISNQWWELYLERSSNLKIVVAHELYRIHCALLDDAWIALEGVERALSGKSHSSLWWGRLHSLRLRLLAEHGDSDEGWFGPEGCLPFRYRTLAFRKPQDNFILLEKTYRAGLLAAKSDAYHRLRFIDYGAAAALYLLKRGLVAPAQGEKYERFINTLTKEHLAISKEKDAVDPETTKKAVWDKSLLKMYWDRVRDQLSHARSAIAPNIDKH